MIPPHNSKITAKYFSNTNLLKKQHVVDGESCNVPGSRDTDLEHSVRSVMSSKCSLKQKPDQVVLVTDGWMVLLPPVTEKENSQNLGGAHSFPKSC